MWTYKRYGQDYFKAFSEVTPAELTARSQLGVEEIPSSDVASGCARFLCRLLARAPWHKKTYRPTQPKN